MKDDGDKELGVDELAERAGVSRRTVRYYVQRGLLPPPQGLGRGKHYAEAHLNALIRIRELQEEGVPLDEIGARLAGRSNTDRGTPRSTTSEGAAAVRPASATQTTWTRLTMGEDVELHVRGRRLTEEQMRKLARAVRNILEETDGER